MIVGFDYICVRVCFCGHIHRCSRGMRRGQEGVTRFVDHEKFAKDERLPVGAS